MRRPRNCHGEARVVDGKNFPVSRKIAAALVTVKPGGLRELHWHPNASEWQYYIQGSGRMTVFNWVPFWRAADERSRTLQFISFTKNVTMIGGLLFIAAYTEQPAIISSVSLLRRVLQRS